MKGIIKSIGIAGILTLSLVSNVYATEGKKSISKSVLESEENEFLTSIGQEYIEGDNQPDESTNHIKAINENLEEHIEKDLSQTLNKNFTYLKI